MLKLLSPSFRVSGVRDEHLKGLFSVLEKGGGGDRWVFFLKGGELLGLHGKSGVLEKVGDPREFLARKGARGFLFPEGTAEGFWQRFSEVSDPLLPLRLAAYIAPLIPDVEPRVEGIAYNFQASERNRLAVEIARRFLPRGKAIALLFPFFGAPYGLYLGFDGHHRLAEVIGAASWRTLPRSERELRELKELGKEVELGIYLSPRGMESLLQEGFSRHLLRELIKEGELRFEPFPMLLRLALLSPGKVKG